MFNLHNQALAYTTSLNTAIRKSNATSIRATANTNVEKPHEKKALQFSFFQNRFSVSFEDDFQVLLKGTFIFFRNQFLKCYYSPLSTLKNAVKDEFFMYDMP